MDTLAAKLAIAFKSECSVPLERHIPARIAILGEPGPEDTLSCLRHY